MSSDPKPLIPPRYANVPSLPIYDPDLPDPLFRTYVRLAGLAWVNDYRETPPLTLAELCAVCQCSERTLWGHLADLRKRGLLSWEMGSGGQMTLSPAQPPAEGEACGEQGRTNSGEGVAANLAALAEFGVKPDIAFARQVAALPHVTPERVRAWGEHYRGQPGIRNLPGLLLHTLQATTRLPRQGRDARGGPRRRDGELPFAPGVSGSPVGAGPGRRAVPGPGAPGSGRGRCLGGGGAGGSRRRRVRPRLGGLRGETPGAVHAAGRLSALGLAGQHLAAHRGRPGGRAPRAVASLGPRGRG